MPAADASGRRRVRRSPAHRPAPARGSDADSIPDTVRWVSSAGSQPWRRSRRSLDGCAPCRRRCLERSRHASRHVDRDTARCGNAVRGAVVPRGQAVLLEPGDGEAGIGVEFALDTAQILVEFAVDEPATRSSRSSGCRRLPARRLHSAEGRPCPGRWPIAACRPWGNVGFLQFLNGRR